MTTPSNSGKIPYNNYVTDGPLLIINLRRNPLLQAFGQGLDPRYNSFLFFDLPKKTSTKDQFVVLGAPVVWIPGILKYP